MAGHDAVSPSIWSTYDAILQSSGACGWRSLSDRTVTIVRPPDLCRLSAGNPPHRTEHPATPGQVQPATAGFCVAIQQSALWRDLSDSQERSGPRAAVTHHHRIRKYPYQRWPFPARLHQAIPLKGVPMQTKW